MSQLLSEQLLSAQAGVLGPMLVDANVSGELLTRLSEQDFTDGRFRMIFQAIRKLYTEGKPVDGITVNETLGGNYNQILADLITQTVTVANAGVYLELLKNSSMLYRLRELGERLSQAEADEWQAVVDGINQICCDKPGVRIRSMAECYQEFLDRKGDGKKPDYLTWGIPDLDRRIYVEGGDMVVLGGYPSAGKTAMALAMSFHIAAGRRVGYFYFENNDRKLFERLVSSTTLVSFGRIKRNDLTEEDYRSIIDLQSKLTSPTLDFIDASGFTVLDIRGIALSRHYDLVVVDYLQKIRAERSRKNVSDFERVSSISSDLQDFGKQTGVTVLALSQLSRPEKKNGKTPAPGLWSLRQSGQIEQDADVVLLLYQDDPAREDLRTLKLAKNKEGEANLAMRMYFDGDTQTFGRFSQQDPPKTQDKPRQVNFWDGFSLVRDDPDNPFSEDPESGGKK